VVLQPCADCSVGQVAFAIQLPFAGTTLLIVKVDALTLDSFKLVYLCAEDVYVGYDTRVP